MTSVKYGPRAQYGRAMLLSQYNDVLIFVEDSTLQFMYVQIFNKIFREQARIEHVFGLGGRKAVIEACLRNPLICKKPAIYIIDGDFDAFNGVPATPSPRLHRLNAYCIENIILTERAVSSIAAESHGNSAVQEVFEVLKFGQLMSSAERIFVPLFVQYAIVSQLDLSIETVSYSVIRFCTKQGDADTLSLTLVTAHMREIRMRIISAIGIDAYRTARARVLESCSRIGAPIRHISGKDYLLPLLILILSKRFHFRDSMNSLKSRLAGIFSPEDEPELTAFVRSAVGID